VSIGKKNILIDASPEFRAQALQYKINNIDALLLTHLHYDHIAGIDDLRIFPINTGKKITCLLSQSTMKELDLRYHYLVHNPVDEEQQQYAFSWEILPKDFGEVDLFGQKIVYFTFLQRETKVTGFRIGEIAYVSDIRAYSEEIFPYLKGIKTLVLSSARKTPTRMHFSLQEGIDFAKKTPAKQIYFTHMSHEINYEKEQKNLPDGFFLAYDGLELSFTV
jgi:phosphoribosyl 1,2-cyclic phosphate phosphodiesterase